MRECGIGLAKLKKYGILYSNEKLFEAIFN